MAESNEGYTIKISTNIPILKNKKLLSLVVGSFLVLLLRWVSIQLMFSAPSSVYIWDILSLGVVAVAISLACLLCGKKGLVASVFILLGNYKLTSMHGYHIGSMYQYWTPISVGESVFRYSLILTFIALIMVWKSKSLSCENEKMDDSSTIDTSGISL